MHVQHSRPTESRRVGIDRLIPDTFSANVPTRGGAILGETAKRKTHFLVILWQVNSDALTSDMYTHHVWICPRHTIRLYACGPMCTVTCVLATKCIQTLQCISQVQCNAHAVTVDSPTHATVDSDECAFHPHYRRSREIISPCKCFTGEVTMPHAQSYPP